MRTKSGRRTASRIFAISWTFRAWCLASIGIADDPRGTADNPLNYPVGTVTIFNGLGNFSENSAFNRSTGGHFDTRVEGYLGDTFNLFPNLNISFGVNYVRESGRTNSDLAPVPCSAINTTIVTTPPCTTGLILD